jgi:D-mannonate dehydratase
MKFLTSTDMWKLMKTLVDVDFHGNMVADHVPTIAGGNPAGHTAWDTSVRSITQRGIEE